MIKKAKREAEMLAAWAMTELSNKRKCHELDQLTQNQQFSFRAQHYVKYKAQAESPTS
jgi:hypothetical protein